MTGLVAFLAACTPSEDVEAPPPTSEPSDLSTRLDALLSDSSAPALAAAIVDRDGLVALGAAGQRRAGGRASVTLDDRWHLGSCTKAMTATLVATFVDEGALTFDSTLPELFPDLAADPAWNAVTMRDLLRHRAGVGAIPVATLGRWFQGGEVTALRADYAVEMLAGAPPLEVGTYAYSNGGYVLAGAALEAIAGASWETLLQERVLEPLGMTECGFGPPGAGQPAGHDATGTPQPDLDNPPALGPAGTVHCSMASWAEFARANLVGPAGEAPIVDAATWVTLHDAPIDDYALGWGVSAREWAGGTTLSHYGSNTLWIASVWIAPDIDRAYLAVTNSGAGEHFELVDATIGELVASDEG